jgi:erythromycin esterase-like protein
MRDARLALVGEAGHGTHVLPAASARAAARRLCARAHRW